ncbi:hypothetical protein [Lacunimicrobium album]
MSSLDQQQFVDYHDYITLQLERTRRHIRSTDLMTAVAGGVGILLTYLLTFVVLDHWVIEGGFSATARVLMLVSVLLLTAGWFVWRVSRPAFNQINSLFAARTLDTAKPDLHNILLTLIDIRRHKKTVAPEIEQSLEKRAALGLSKLQIDQTVDHTSLMRSLYFLLAIVVIFALYALLSPKQIAGTLLRAVAPSADIQAATRTQINNVTPGKDIEVPARSQVEISALITGDIPEEVLLKYTTDDRRYVDETVLMKPVDGDAKGKYAAILAGENGRGLQQNHSYYVEAGDAKSTSYRVTVKATPVAKVDQVFLQPPSYTRLEPTTIQAGDIDALEGTKVAISASVSMPVKVARIRFTDSEDLTQKAEEVMMSVNDGTKLSAELPPLKIRTDGTFPRFYHIECKTEDGASDPAPVLYRMNIRPDQAPMVRLKSPTGDLVQPANGIIPLIVEAQDPDFLLHSLTLRVEKAGERIHGEPLFEKRVQGTRVKYDWRLESLHLLDGDEIAFWVEARDNKEPASNLSNTQKIRVKIQAPQDEAKVEKALEEQKAQQKKQEEKEQQDAQQKGENQQPGQAEQQDQPADGAQKNQEQKMSDQPQEGEKSPENGEKAKGKNGEGESGNDGDGQSDNQKTGENGEGQPQQDGKMNDSKTGDGGESGEKSNPQNGDNTSNENPSKQEQSGNQSGQQNQDGKPKSGGENQPQPGREEMSEQGEKGNQSQGANQPQFDKEGADDDLVLNELMKEHQKKEQEKQDKQQKNNKSDSQSPEGEASPDGKEGANDQQKNDGQGKPSEAMNDDQKPSKDDENSSKPKTDGKPSDETSDDGQPGDDKGADENADKMSKENKGETGEEMKSSQKGEQKEGEKPTDEKSKDEGASGEQEKNDGNKPPEGMEKKGGSGGEKSDEQPKGDEPKDGTGGDQPSEKMKPDQDGNSSSNASQDDKGKEGTSPDPNAPMGKNEATPDKDATGKPADDPNVDAMKSDNTVKREEGTKPTTREGDPKDPNRKPENQAKGGDQDKPEQSSGKSSSSEKQDSQQKGRQKSDGSQSGSEQKKGGDSSSDQSQKGGEMQDGKSKSSSKDGQPGDGPSEKSQDGAAKGGDQSGMNEEGQKAGGEQKPGENQKQDDVPRKPDEKQGDGDQKMGDEKPGGQQQGGQQKSGQQQSGDQGGKSKGESGGKSAGEGGKSQQLGEASDQPPSSSQPSGGGGAASKQAAPAKKGERAPGAADGPAQNGEPQKGEAGAGEGPSKSAPSQEQSLEDKKKAADLVLKQLEEDLKRGDVDEEFLKRLGWTETDLKKFRERMAKMSQEKEVITPEEMARRKQYQEMLKNLNLNTNRPAAKSSQGFGKSEVDSFGPSNIPAPAQYQELERAYKQSLLKKKD